MYFSLHGPSAIGIGGIQVTVSAPFAGISEEMRVVLRTEISRFAAELKLPSPNGGFDDHLMVLLMEFPEPAGGFTQHWISLGADARFNGPEMPEPVFFAEPGGRPLPE